MNTDIIISDTFAHLLQPVIDKVKHGIEEINENKK